MVVNEITQTINTEETKIDIWFVVIPKTIWLKCRPESVTRTDKRLEDYLQRVLSGQGLLFSELKAEIEEYSRYSSLDNDFHNQLKARLIQERVQAPIQIMIEETLQFLDKRGQAYEQHMQAHLAWTQSSTLFYKLGKLPWKLIAIRDGVCYVRLVFKQYPNKADGYACSAAQLFLDSGDGTVFKGNGGLWKGTNREFHLDIVSAKKLITKALVTYKEKKGEFPKELFIHGKAKFNEYEQQGFAEATQDLGCNSKIIGVLIKEDYDLKLYKNTTGKENKYGVLRSLSLQLNEISAYLWTRGFVPRLNTSMTLEIPVPLYIEIVFGDGEINQVIADILSLTKLNYNACQYADGLPVTLRFADNIGKILTAVENIPDEVLPFKFYI
jgi:hypothetical protein